MSEKYPNHALTHTPCAHVMRRRAPGVLPALTTRPVFGDGACIAASERWGGLLPAAYFTNSHVPNDWRRIKPVSKPSRIHITVRTRLPDLSA